MAYISLGVFGGIYLIHWIDAIFFSSDSLEEQLANRGAFKYDDVYISINVFDVQYEAAFTEKKCILNISKKF